MWSACTLYRYSLVSFDRRSRSIMPPSLTSRYRWNLAGSESDPNNVPRRPKSIWFTSGTSGAGGAAVLTTSGCAFAVVEASWAAAPPDASRMAAATANDLVRITSSCLPMELVTSRVIRAVDLRMAVHAASADRAVAGRRDLGAVINRRRMPAGHVAALAEHRFLRHQ